MLGAAVRYTSIPLHTSSPRGEASQRLKGRVGLFPWEAGLEKASQSREVSIRDLALQVRGSFWKCFTNVSQPAAGSSSMA